jgi:hypothetical protein
MNLDQLQRKLFVAARSHPPSDAVPYGFEKRILARVQARPAHDAWAFWAQGLWRAAASCVALTVVLCAWSVLSPANHLGNSDVSQDLESTVLAAVDQEAPPAELQR